MRVIFNLILVIVAICFINKAYNDGYQDGYNHSPKWSRQLDEAGQKWHQFAQWVGLEEKPQSRMIIWMPYSSK